MPSDRAKPLLVRKIFQIDATHLGIEWNDGSQGRWNLAQLRRLCPCAACVDETTGERKLNPASIPDDLTCSRIESVGRYALTIHFADGHNTGIYSFKMLKDCSLTSIPL